MAEFVRYIPGFVSGLYLDKFEFKDFNKEVLEKYSYCLEGGEYHWCYNDSGNGVQQLMINTKNNDKWWVIGTVKGLDLSKYLPKIIFTHKEK